MGKDREPFEVLFAQSSSVSCGFGWGFLTELPLLRSEGGKQTLWPFLSSAPTVDFFLFLPTGTGSSQAQELGESTNKKWISPCPQGCVLHFVCTQVSP